MAAVAFTAAPVLLGLGVRVALAAVTSRKG